MPMLLWNRPKENTLLQHLDGDVDKWDEWADPKFENIDTITKTVDSVLRNLSGISKLYNSQKLDLFTNGNDEITGSCIHFYLLFIWFY